MKHNDALDRIKREAKEDRKKYRKNWNHIFGKKIKGRSKITII